MGLTRKNQYDSYTLAYKVHAVKMTQKKGVKAVDVATSLGIHPVMLYRWRQEFKEGRLSENKHMRKKANPPERRPEDAQALKTAEHRIKELEKRLSAKEEEVIILKKAKRFFSDRRNNDTRS